MGWPVRAVINKDDEENAYVAALKGSDERLVRQVANQTILEYINSHFFDRT